MAVSLVLRHNMHIFNFVLRHMHVFKGGRTAFLEFLRNLTPQVLLLSMAVIAGNRLELSCCYLENWKQTAIFLCFSAVGIAAVWANSSLFVENYLISTKRIDRASRRFLRSGVTGWRHFKVLGKYAWRKQRGFFVEAIVVSIIVEFALVAVIWSALGSGAALLRTFRG